MIVDYYGVTLVDNFVKPTLPVSNYRTNVTGIKPEDLESGKHGTLILPDRTFPTLALTPQCPEISVDDAVPFDEIQARVALVIADKIIIGHSLWNDLAGTFPSPLSLLTSLVSHSRFFSSVRCTNPVQFSGSRTQQSLREMSPSFGPSGKPSA